MIQQYCTLPHTPSLHGYGSLGGILSFQVVRCTRSSSLSLQDNIILYCIICTSATSSSGSSGVKQNVEMAHKVVGEGPSRAASSFESAPASLEGSWARWNLAWTEWPGSFGLLLTEFDIDRVWHLICTYRFDQEPLFYFVVLTESIWNQDQICYEAYWSTPWSP